MIHRAFRYRLYPTSGQEAALAQIEGVVRLVYNLALEQRRDFWRQAKALGECINFVFQCRELTALRREFPWIRDCSVVCQQKALKDLDRAFANFFEGRASFPRFRRKGEAVALRFAARDVPIKRLNGKWCEVLLPKVGRIKFRRSFDMRGRPLSATFGRDGLGWHVSFACEIERETTTTHLPAVGIDRGVVNTLMLSTGEAMSVPGSLEAIERRHRAAQRVVARRKKGSKRRLRAVRRAAKLAARRARIRRDFHHKAALSIAQRFGLVVIEDLKIKNMTASGKRKRGLNRSILNQGWYSFETILRYKLEDRGGRIVAVDPRFTSQTCSECGVVDRKSRESQAAFSCQHCGFTGHADQNAAINILRRSTPYMDVEEAHFASVEASTTAEAA